MCVLKSHNFFHDKTSLGVAVGAGWQSLVAYINIGCYYVFGLPAGIVLGFTLNFGVVVIYHPSILLIYVIVEFRFFVELLILSVLGRRYQKLKKEFKIYM